MKIRTSIFKRMPSFMAGMVAMLALVTIVAPASAASGNVEFNKVGIRLLRQQRVEAGEIYVAPNGQHVPSSITYTDVTGGMTNYLSVRQISELLDADISWNSEENSVDIGVLPQNTNINVSSSADGATDKLTANTASQYGVSIGALTEVDPSQIQGLLDGTATLSRSYAYNTRVQYGLGSSFPEITVKAKPTLGKWLVYSVTNNGEIEQETVVSRKVTITTGRRESFPNVLVAPGETVVRAFRIAEDADPMRSTFGFSVHGTPDLENQTDVTVSVMLYN